jgi:hypothetical protein
MILRVLRAALTETQQVAAWYEEKRLGLGEDFLHEVEVVYVKIEEHPHRSLRVVLSGLEEREFHQAMLRRFPYKVIYEVCEDEIVVLAVAHTRRRPKYWSGRV